MSEHTPGPWTFESGFIVSSAGRIADVGGVDASFDPETAEADGRLIAAAPDLLAALKAIDATVEGIPADVAAQMIAAIVKAEGR